VACLCEAARQPAGTLPRVHDVDVLVVGGSGAAVDAAVAAAQAGASVFLAAPRPYLGDDMAGTLRLWADEGEVRVSPLSKRIYGDPKPGENQPAVRTTPLKVKQILDRALIDNQVRFITGTYATETLLDAAGKPAGAVLLNRSGRFVVRAKCVIDATDRAWLTRQAGAKFRSFKAGTYPMTQVVIAGEAPVAEGLSTLQFTQRWVTAVDYGWKVATPTGMPSVITGSLFICTMNLPLTDGSVSAQAEAQQTLRDAVFVSSQLDSAEKVIFTPPDSIIGTVSSREPAPSPESLSLDVMRPKGLSYIWVLGPLADVSRDAAASVYASPINGMTLGHRLGTAVAGVAAGRGNVGPVHVASEPKSRSDPEIVREYFGPWLSAARSATGTIPTAVCDLPVLGTCDVLVVGGGTAGSPAAIAAARAGRSVIICEYQYALGGVQTVGLLGSYYHGNPCGFTLEIDAGTRATGAVGVQSKAEWYRRQIRASGGKILFGTMGCGVVMSGHRVVGAVVAGPDGRRGVIRAGAVIDATGNADLAAAAGEPTEFLDSRECSLQSATMNYRPLGKSSVNIGISFVNDTDGYDMCFLPLRARQTWGLGQYWDQSQLVDSRERRRLIGEVYLVPTDFMNQRTFPDTIVQCKSTHDTHGQATHDLLMMSRISHPEAEYEANLPYRALLPKQLDGLLVTGLGISAHRDTMAVLRMQRDVQNQGYAAGYAAALAVKEAVMLRAIDVKALQQHLMEKGILTPRVLNYTDNYPLSDRAFSNAIVQVPDEYAGVWVLMTDTNRAIPGLRRAYDATTNPTAKARYGTVLALFGDAYGAPGILAPLSMAANWDYGGWDWRPGFGRKLSHFDTYLMALGRIGYTPALPDILRLAALLDQTVAYSHFRAVALACEGIGDASAVPVLSAVLQKPQISGHALAWKQSFPVYADAKGNASYSGEAGTMERNQCLRELALVRALYRLGDDSAQRGKTALEAYAADPRSAYATHASLVLEEHSPAR
jgi:NADPH-dependent 2,4-dienoyl-CoA reductase/sulfur reductase-like enzyme